MDIYDCSSDGRLLCVRATVRKWMTLDEAM